MNKLNLEWDKSYLFKNKIATLKFPVWLHDNGYYSTLVWEKESEK